MVSVIVPSYGGFESLGFPSSDHLKYQLGCASPSQSSVQSRSSSSSGSFHRKRKVIDASKGNGGPPLLRSPHSSSLYKPLYVDCSVEYELPNVPKVPKNSLPLLVIHPGYEPKNNQGSSVSSRRKRDASSLVTHNRESLSSPLVNIHSSSTTNQPHHPLYSLSQSAKGNHAYTAPCYSVPSESPPAAKRSRPSQDWLRHELQQRRLCEQQQLKRYQQQQQQLWRLNCCPPLIQHSWGSRPCCNSSCCSASNKLWLQQQLYAKQQQAYYQQQQQQQLLRSSSCPGCLSGKCLFVWNKENLSAYRC